METKTNQNQAVKTTNPLLEARAEVISKFSDTTFRIEWIKTIKGVDFINDAKSSNVLMSLEALEQCNCNLIWIASDEFLSADFGLIKDVIKEKVKAILYISKISNPELEQNCKGLVNNVIRLGSIDEAVVASLSFTNEGDCVLYSPAAPGYTQLDTYQNRGEKFNASVQLL